MTPWKIDCHVFVLYIIYLLWPVIVACLLSHSSTIYNVICLSVSVLANNALRAHHASAHGGVSTNSLSDILLSFFEIIFILFYGGSYESGYSVSL